MNPTFLSSKPRIRIHKDGRATISGLNAQDLSHLLNLASIEASTSLENTEKRGEASKFDDFEDEALREHMKELEEENQKENVAFCQSFIKLTGLLQTRFKDAMDVARGSNKPKVLTKAERLAKVREEQKERKFMDEFMAMVMADARAQKASQK